MTPQNRVPSCFDICSFWEYCILVDTPDAAFWASMDDLLSSNLHTYLGLVMFLPLISDGVVELDPDPAPVVDPFMQFDIGN